MNVINRFVKTTQQASVSNRYVKVCYVLLFSLAALLRFYQLGDPPTPAFDEVYFPKFAYEYERGEHFYHTHPPLARYAFYLGMKTYYSMPWTENDAFGELEFKDLSPVAYRWVNACIGLLLCGIITLLCWRLSRSHLVTLLALLFVATDGALVVASRFGLSNAHITFWGFLSLLLFLTAFLKPRFSWKYFTLACLCFGCVVSVKWNGLSYWVTALGFVTAAMVCRFLGLALNQLAFPQRTESEFQRETIDSKFNVAFSHLRLKRLSLVILVMIILPLLVYRVVWVPDRIHNDNTSFVGIHQQNWGYHSSEEKVGSHPYCSGWYSWPIMQRPIGYFFEKREYELPEGGRLTRFKDIHSFGNPLLYWASSIAIWVILFSVLWNAYQFFSGQRLGGDFYLRLFLATGYFASWLPWAFVSRCTFLYHYQSASIFSFVALAWCLTWLWRQGHFQQGCLRQQKLRMILRTIVLLVVVFIVTSFIFFLPISLGIELDKSAFYDRMWFRSWI